ncbi:probable fatty acyl-CoA reductase 4 [Arachis hypogaea]|uniref:probable fatty acyl-CoA reductase 4 n=1 Tax=Arachis hypogaea TaxID=3818 RepID=UPI003B20FB1C
MAEFTSNSVEEYFKEKTILITGATGFLAKILVEKILRVQPNIKRLYLVVRASNPHIAVQRLHNEVFEKKLFKMQKDKWGEKFSSFLADKVVAVAGDVSLHNFGIKDQILIEEMLDAIDIIVHTAGTTTLDERFDVAMDTNTMGAYNAINFAKMCHRIEVFLHVSTAYVCGEAKGLIPEESFRMGQTLKSSLELDISLEKQLIEEKLSELQEQNANQETITSIMKEFGATRANLYGWPNTYTFTKAMGEMLVMSMKGNIPLIITRPTAVIGTHSEPFPGWIEGVRTIDFVFVEYFKGAITSFVGHPNITMDLDSRLKRTMNLYRPYGLFEGIFDDENTEKLRIAIKGVGKMDKEYNFDPKSIDWKDYLMNVHFPGLIKYTMQPKM